MKRPKEVNRKKKLKCFKNYRKTKTNPRLKRLKEYSIPRETERDLLIPRHMLDKLFYFKYKEDTWVMQVFKKESNARGKKIRLALGFLLQETQCQKHS